MKDSISGYRPQVKYTLVASRNGVSLVSSYRGSLQGVKVGQVARRGEVKGFSRASARRFRHFLMGVDYTGAIAVTLTHPVVIDGMRGPEAAFDALRKSARRMPWLSSLIWRKEVQLNGTPHFHCILFPAIPDGVEAAERLVKAWVDECLKSWDVPPVFKDATRADMVKAHHDRRRPAVVVMDGSCYVRYLLDHQSKHKKEQAETEGRAWGVWQRSNLRRVRARTAPLSPQRYWVAARIMRKACRYQLKADCPFGWRHTRGRRASGLGAVDYFARCADGVMADKVLGFVLADAFEPASPAVSGRYLAKQIDADKCRVGLDV